MISQSMVDAINAQVVAEFYSSYLYLSMAAYFESQGLEGFSSWMKVQAQEELTHGVKLFNHVNERDGRVILGAIEQPETDWDSPLAAFKAAYAHEQKVTSLINDLVTLAREEKDYASENFLQWFVNEQVEEEASAKAIVDQLSFVAGNPHALFMLNRELGQRTFTPPAANAGE
jgi:ferritin